MQCDQIGRCIAHWATFHSLWQQLICPHLPHSEAIFCKGVKIYHFSSEIILGNFFRHLAIFSGHTSGVGGKWTKAVSKKWFSFLVVGGGYSRSSFFSNHRRRRLRFVFIVEIVCDNNIGSQCEQIWRNFSTLEKLWKSLGIFKAINWYFEKL